MLDYSYNFRFLFEYIAMHTEYFIGLMSGTSTDGVDGVLVSFKPNYSPPTLIASSSLNMPSDLRAELLNLNQVGHNELERAYLASQKLAKLYSISVNELLEKSQLKADQIQAIGAHGQTIRHHPEKGYSIQLNAPALLAELSQINVIADFRSRDLAAGGQGAPLIPAFHEAIFKTSKDICLLNIGGIANVTILSPNQASRGFDTGPGNMLMDSWCFKHLKQRFDAEGAWGLTGQCNLALLDFLIQNEPWFKLPTPKSTGRDLFNFAWLEKNLEQFQQQTNYSLKPQDVQATLRTLTTQTIIDAIKNQQTQAKQLIVFGGGALNKALMKDLSDQLADWQVSSSDEWGIPTQYMEAMAFAWLAKAFCDGQKACTPAITGARHATIAGCLYPK